MALKAPHSGGKRKTVSFCSWRRRQSNRYFDYKPALQKYAGGKLPKLPGLSGEIEGFLDAPHARFPAHSSSSATDNAAATSRRCSADRRCVDDLAFIYGVKVDNNNHGPATMHVTTGSQLQGSASVGSGLRMVWASEPEFARYVVIQDPRGSP